MAISTDSRNTNLILKHFSADDPAEPVPFTKLKTSDFLPAIESALAVASQRLQMLRDQTSEPDFTNTFEYLETMSEELDLVAEIYFNLLSAEADEEFHSLAQAISPKLAKFSNDVSLDEKVFARVKKAWEFCQKNSASIPGGLTEEQMRLAEKSFKNFVRNGALLVGDQKAQLRKIDEELARLTPKFSENVLKATYAFELELKANDDFAGLPQSVSDAAKALAQSKGKSCLGLVSLEAPSMIPFLTHSSRRDLREKVWLANAQKATTGEFDNSEILTRIASLRHQRAQLLGFKTHAHYVLSERMAENPETVAEFLSKLENVAVPAAKKDLSLVAQLAKELDGLAELKPWDFAFYSEKLKERLFDLNDEQLRPYFPLNQVVSGLFEHARRLYNLEFRPRPQTPVYHPDCMAYEVVDTEKNKFVGLFYTDFFPRPTKRGGAWMTALREQGLFDGKVRRPHISIVCNVTKPVQGKPSLLSFDEVRTLFHEFGHALHGLLSECTYRSVAGTNVFWDFVELPSQIMENWIFEQESLSLFARHYQTGEPLPQKLAEKIKASSRFLSGWQTVRQLTFATLDLAWHAKDPSGVKNVEEFETQALARLRLLPHIPGAKISNAFGHIFAGGYSAGYYSYKWAEVLDADAFEAFKEKGLFDKETAQKFRATILSRGGIRHPKKMYQEFRGRDADPGALFRRSGLL